MTLLLAAVGIVPFIVIPVCERRWVRLLTERPHP
jgi:hypothetical protein